MSSSSPTPRPRHSLLSSLHPSLASRSRSITDFYIDPDDPWRSYFPGDVVRGSVVLTVVRPVRITHLVISLHGFVKVYKNTVPAGEAAAGIGPPAPGRGRRSAEYLGDGLATLFEDELVLCGDGRLKEGIYKFRFEMVFPPYALPSSVSFERGAISYMLTSTLTKPTTMNPTISCQRRVNLLENIDIAPFPAPKARIVTVETVSRRRTRGKGKGVEVTETPVRDLSTPTERRPLSPSSSNVSSSSRISSNSCVDGQHNESKSATTSLSDKTITTKTEVMRAGLLPGDTLPVKVTVNHSYHVRSPHGIIVTLYRQGRIDLHPAIPIGTSADGKKPVYEDIYPRSRTGLGGLSIGSSRPNSVHRKDLSQTFAPLITDPHSLTAVIKTSIRLPENAFPTITRVPGGMINFRYYVEVVTDLRNKQTAPERFLPRFNIVSGGRTFSSSGQILQPGDGASVTSNWAGNILDTHHIRREKGVTAVAFEVVVGTRDSQRGQTPVETPLDFPSPSPDAGEYREPTHTNGHTHTAQDYAFPEVPYAEYGETYGDSAEPEPAYEFEAPPQLEESVDEKAQLRRAEETLLPSQPPDAGPSGEFDATAPVLPEDDTAPDYQPLPPEHLGSPELAQPASFSAANDGPSDDKQELERQRLMAQASAPGAEANAEADAEVADEDAGPSAPVLDDDEHWGSEMANGDEALPRYQR